MMTRQTDNSRRLYQNASRLIPGGVNSPARAWAAVGGDPIFFESGKGSRIIDVDGNSYIDYVCSWGPLILGHAHPDIVQAAQNATKLGASFGAPTQIEVAAAKLIVDAVPSIDMVRFVNSGTEASMSAMRLARAATGRNLILKFDGGYHGHDDALLVRAGSGLATQGIADSAGVNSNLAQDTIVAPYNDLETVERIFQQHRECIACVIIEPIAGNMGVVPAQQNFLRGLRKITSQDGCLLIFDEVISGFRVAYAGAQYLYDILPDITCLGKIIGGGFPVGAYGASTELMSHVAPLGSMYQAGTLSGNPVAMAAGTATMQQLAKPGTYEKLAQKTQSLADGLRSILAELEIPATINQATGMLTVFFGICSDQVAFLDRETSATSTVSLIHDEQPAALQPSIESSATIPLLPARVKSPRHSHSPPHSGRNIRTTNVTYTNVSDMTTASSNDRKQYNRFFHNMLDKGIYLPPSPFETWFISLAHSDEDIEYTIQAAHQSLN